MDSENNNHSVATEEAMSADSAAPAPDGRDSVAEITADRDRIAKEKAELQDLLQRRQAEFDNYRRRIERERSELLEFASMDTIKALLPVLDDFERALKVESADKEYARGMEMIYQRLFEALRKLGLEQISDEVPLFNPHIHHAVEMVETQDHPDQTILEEYQPGYYFKGRLLRPAMVKVAVNA
ncbi:MAG: nucleotide exchange factor GrpE [Acidobacteriaceae bacterium]|nr:nucleotide exchange factor GrpE [Acidobacteriaceae bacterium]MBV8573340.1 nucleotide exchange factor GrpE [Acidobacteriaceae bacterium]